MELEIRVPQPLQKLDTQVFMFLNLIHSQIGDTGAAAISEALKLGTHMSALNLCI
jgi:hypothetical protein